MRTPTEVRTGRRRGIATTAIVLFGTALAGCTTPQPLRWDTPTLALCQKKIGIETGKLDRKLAAALAKCKKLYRSAVAGGGPLAVAVGDCDAALAKSFLFPDPTLKSAVAKRKVKLDALVTNGHCSDADLLALGHAPAGALGDQWSRLIVLQRVKAAYEAESQSTSDMGDIFKQYASAGCVNCAALAQPPCRRTVCTLAPTSSVEYAGGGSTALAGALSFDVCSSALFGNDLALFGAPSSQGVSFDTGAAYSFPAPGVQRACVRMLGAQGLVQSAGSALPGVAAVSVCQDHVVNMPDSDECTGGGAICSSSSADPQHAGLTNGGVCTTISPTGAIAGGAFVLGRFEVSLVGTGMSMLYPDTRGADGLPCTYDDLAAAPSVSFSIPLVNGLGASGDIKDADGVDATTLSATVGLPALFDPAKVAKGDLSGGALAAVLPGLHAMSHVAPIPPYLDGLSAFRIDCQ